MKSHPKEVMRGLLPFEFGLKENRKMPFVKQRISLSLIAMFHLEILHGEQGPLGKDKSSYCHSVCFSKFWIIELTLLLRLFQDLAI